MSQTLFITGASGHLGRRVIELLLEQNAGSQVIAVTRTPEKLADFAARGVNVRHGSFDDTAGLVEAFKGADRLLLISTDVVAEPGRRIQQPTNAVTAAEKAGVKQVVYTSLINPIGSPVTLAIDHQKTEEALEASSMDYTILRNNVYSEQVLGSIVQALKMGGSLVNAGADGRTGFVTREDCARAAAAALTDGFTGRRILDITGPSAPSYSEIAALASKITGQTITYIPVEPEALTNQLTQVGLPPVIVDLVVSFDAAAAQGKLNVVSNTVEELTGKAPTSIEAFLTANQAAFAEAVTE